MVSDPSTFLPLLLIPHACAATARYHWLHMPTIAAAAAVSRLKNARCIRVTVVYNIVKLTLCLVT